MHFQNQNALSGLQCLQNLRILYIIIIIYLREKRKRLCLRFANIHYDTNLPHSKMAATLPV